MKKIMAALAALAALTSLAVAADAPSLQRGRELFESTRLGTSGKSCAGCHPGGSKLAQVAPYDQAQLAEIINRCITNPLRGKALDPESADMESLIMYIRTFAK